MYTILMIGSLVQLADPKQFYQKFILHWKLYILYWKASAETKVNSCFQIVMWYVNKIL